MAKRRKKSEASRLRTKCLKLAKDVAKFRDDYTCQKCGATNATRQIHGSHVKPVSTCGSMLAVDPVNIKALCARCHMDWHEDPTAAADWFAETFPGRLETINWKLVANKSMGSISILWWRQRVIELTDQLNELKQEKEIA